MGWRSQAILNIRGNEMKYLCQIFFEERKLNGLSKEEDAALNQESLAYDQWLRDRGHLVAAQALERVAAARTLRPGKEKAMVMDGPFAETREQIGGFILIEAESMERALELAAGIPSLRLGGVEVRPVRELI
jgi:hypothetical protein